MTNRSVSHASNGRSRILAAALPLFADRGYDGTSTVDVAKAAGVTHPLVHHHFGSKQGLWEAVAELALDDVRRILPERPFRAAPVAWIEEVTGRLVAFAAAHPHASKIVAREAAAGGSPRLGYLMDRFLRTPFRVVIEAMAEGQRQGVVLPDVRPELVLFLCLGAGVHVFTVAGMAAGLGVDTASPTVQAEYVSLFRRMLFGGVLRRPSTQGGESDV
jgi:TetR/AcrR family transcriptional regulator